MSNFRDALLTAADQAARAGEIDRLDVFHLRLATSLPRVRKQLETECCQHAVASGLAAANQSSAAIDWNNLVPFLKELLPVILEIIKTVIALF